MKDRDKAEAQWQTYVVEAREAFYKEKERHAKALKVFDRDIQEAQHLQSEARRLLRDQVLRAEQEAEEDAMEEDAADGEWERMMEAHERENVLADDAVLRGARVRRTFPDTSYQGALSAWAPGTVCLKCPQLSSYVRGQIPTRLPRHVVFPIPDGSWGSGGDRTRQARDLPCAPWQKALGGVQDEHQGVFQDGPCQGSSTHRVPRQASGQADCLDAFRYCSGDDRRRGQCERFR